METIRIATAHSSHMKDSKHNQEITIDLIGSSPQFQFIWIDDVCYSIRKTARTLSIHKTK